MPAQHRVKAQESFRLRTSSSSFWPRAAFSCLRCAFTASTPPPPPPVAAAESGSAVPLAAAAWATSLHRFELASCVRQREPEETYFPGKRIHNLQHNHSSCGKVTCPGSCFLC